MPPAGATKAATCFACHGPGGNGAINPEWPKLAGQGSAYIDAQLHAFKCGGQPAAEQAKCGPRKQPVMMGQVLALSDGDMNDVAAFFAAQSAVPGVASKDAIAVAEKLYRAGDAARGLPACAACHNPNGLGNAAAAFPRLAGQNSKYTANQLNNYAACAAKDYKDCDRGASDKGRIMSAVASRLKGAEIEALASYVSGLQ